MAALVVLVLICLVGVAPIHGFLQLVNAVYPATNNVYATAVGLPNGVIYLMGGQNANGTQRTDDTWMYSTGIQAQPVLMSPMPRKLSQSCAVLQRMMDLLMSGLLFEICLVYIDDIIIFSKTFEEHLQHVETVFKRLRDANIKIHKKKSQFFCGEILFLGHRVSREGTAPHPDNVAKVLHSKPPTSKTELRTFLGLCGYYRRYVDNYASIAEPLTTMTSKNVKFQWTARHTKAFNKLKKILTSDPILQFPDFDQPFILCTDASDVGLGAVLQQHRDGKEVVIAYWSRVLNSAERNYTTTEKECLALVDACKHFRQYLIAREFQALVDHRALQWLMNNKEPTSRLMRWSLKLQDYTFNIIHRPGKDNGNADALSRPPIVQVSDPTQEISIAPVNLLEDIPTPELAATEIAKLQREDPVLSTFYPWLEDGELPASDAIKAERIRIETRDLFIDEDGLLYRTWFPYARKYQGSVQQLVVPMKLRPEILRICHDSPFSGGHLGVGKTYARVMQRYFWKGMSRDVTNWVNSCTDCSKRKIQRQLKPGKMQTITPRYPWNILGMDLMGQFAPTPRGNQWILVIIDYYTKFVEAFAIPDASAETIARIFVNEIVCRYGAPDVLLTDRGKNFMSELIAHVNQVLGVKKVNTSAYHPQTDGLAEKFNQTLVEMLKNYLNPDADDWDLHLRPVILAYQNVVQSSTGFAPAELMFGRFLKMPYNIELFRKEYGDPESIQEFAHELLRRFDEIYTQRDINSDKAHERQERNYNKKRSDVTFEEKEEVYMEISVPEPGIPEKFQKRRNGPFIITKKVNNILYAIKDPESGKESYVHVSKLSKAHPRRPELVELPPPTEVSIKKERARDQISDRVQKNSKSQVEEQGSPKAEEDASTPRYKPRLNRSKDRNSIFNQLRSNLLDLLATIRSKNLTISQMHESLLSLLGHGSPYIVSSQSTRNYEKKIKQDLQSRERILQFLQESVDHFDLQFAIDREKFLASKI